MRLLLSILLVLSAVTVVAHAREQGENPATNYCSVENKNICAHLEFINPPTTKTEGQFVAHVVAPAGQEVQNFKLDLWMQMGSHGHGSSPVDITPLAEENHFQIKNAWFVMTGTWLVRIDFDLEGTHYHIEIPVSITQ